MARVRIDSGPRTGIIVELTNARTVFGRHESCDFVLSHPTVSRHHFIIESVQAKHLIVDQESGNGTFVNGEPISWVELKDNDVIKVGPFSLVFEDTWSEPLRPVNESQASSPVASRFSEDYPVEYLMGIQHFNSGMYFEAHEIWEEIWLRSSDEARVFYQMLIQAAVALLHHQRGNYRGARGMYQNVVEKLAILPPAFMSLDLVDFKRQFLAFFESLKQGNWEDSRYATSQERVLLRSVEEKSNQGR
jgi:hypothetical protein